MGVHAWTPLGLSRSASSAEVSDWVAQMKSGLSREQLIVEFTKSSEFWTLSGETNSGFVHRLYTTILNREPDGAGKTYHTERLDAGESKESVIRDILYSDEHLSLFISTQYLRLLERSAEPSAIEAWKSRMKSDLNQQGLIKELLLSQEYFDLSMKKGYERNNK
ncbi:DUF4214 domain-containing protein [Thalassomonas sp. RHCl1]|uniref:DUF4214 domain-containing protein n=1 Tax=Thalassomonas sp. RHCl1 TaxID=2995320 RepID=UPI00248B1945|nr:DUF4214 domain-containing protein [Thalassomonas sp. RHCl1]